MACNCLIVDDEAPARSLLRAYVQRTPGLQLVAECKNASQAQDALANHAVHLLFLDIQLPDMLGTDLARSLPPAMRVIFTTAYPQFALEGFDLHAMDYLLKPIAYPRFQQAVEKALQWLQALPGNPGPPTSNDLYLRVDRRFYRVPVNQILYIRSDSEYAIYHTAEKRYMVLDALKRIAEELPPEFFRVHRSYIVNLQYATSLRGNRLLVAKQEIPIGKNYRQLVEQRFQQL
jgi:DNA-binding LytR/AlgR family response regulator